jgi:thiamine biosynthesis protein ThiS
MKIIVKMDKKSEIEVRDKATIDDLLEQLGVNRETVIVRRNGEISIEEETLKSDDFIEIIRAISGG